MRLLSFLAICFLIPFLSSAFDLGKNSAFTAISHGPVNAFEIRKNNQTLAINAAQGKADVVLLTHARRDVVEAARATGAKVIVAPEASRDFLEKAEENWQAWWDKRFNYYEQQVTRLPVKSFPATHYLKDGEEFEWQGLMFRFLETPGYTRDGGTYILEWGDNRKAAFTGELLLEGGKVPDLYSFQNKIPEAKIGGYHGYLGRLGDWITSVEKVRSEMPDQVFAAKQSAALSNWEKDAEIAISRARKIYRNYLSTNALYWYFGKERMGQCADLVLGPDHGLKGMPFAEHVDLPDWCQHIGTTKLLLSEDGSGFALDVGGKRQLEELRKALADGLINSLDGIFVTHLHNDHAAFVADAQKEFGCPVYAIPEVAGPLQNPGDWFLPGLSPNPVEEVIVKTDGELMKWKEFTFTFHFYPGQMYNHGALLVEKPDHDPVFFIGDSFSPSGIDDYCLMNRNLMRDDTGYALCFRKIEALPEVTWLVNQHIPHLFRFNEKELTFLKTAYNERKKLIADFTPWDDPNFAIDEQWAWLFPYGQEAAASESVTVTLKVWNHSLEKRKFTASLRSELVKEPLLTTVEIAGREEGELPFTFTMPDGIPAGKVSVLTCDLEIDGKIRLPEWRECLIRSKN